ncbi:MAG: ACT domain-containing protein [bacterium]|nr:ACT domain-containing protein [Candidatus Aquidulcis frankliniae]
MSEAIAYAGEPGAFAEDALLAYFGAAAPALSVSSFGDVRAAVLDGRATYGVLPIENLINGTVRETLDLLRDGALEIVGEVVVPVSLVLAALPGVTLEQVERVYSHAQALAQAEEYLRSRPWALLTTYNTAGAGAMIRERGERDAAAVLSPRAAAIHGLTPLTGPIEGVQGNRTRFWIVQRAGGAATRVSTSPARTTVLLGLRNEPGTLLAALTVIANAGVNISKLESRPNRVGEWEYIFWLDLDGAADSPEILGVMQGLTDVTLERRILGSYPRGEAL